MDDQNQAKSYTYLSVVDLWHFGTDPDPRICTAELRIRMRTPALFVSGFQAVLRIRDVYPGSWFLPIPDPGSRISDPGSKNSNKRERWKKNLMSNLFI